MGEFVGLVTIVMVFGIPLLSIWSKHQRKIAELRLDAATQASAQKAAQYATHIAELEERVRVLERIVTDKGYDVASQIEALRDTRRVEDKLEEKRDQAVN